MAQLYTNENFPLLSVNVLRDLGHDVQTSHAAGHANQAMSDAAVLAFTTVEGRILVTLNRRHFIRLHAENSHHAGIIVCTFDADFDGLARRIDAAIGSPEPLAGKLIRINRSPN